MHTLSCEMDTSTHSCEMDASTHSCEMDASTHSCEIDASTHSCEMDASTHSCEMDASTRTHSCEMERINQYRGWSVISFVHSENTTNNYSPHAKTFDNNEILLDKHPSNLIMGSKITHANLSRLRHVVGYCTSLN